MAKINVVNGSILGLVLLIFAVVVFGLLFKKSKKAEALDDYELTIDDDGNVYAKDVYETYDLSDYFDNIDAYQEIIENNTFLEELDSVVIQGLYNGYEIDNFRFNEFTSRVRNKVYVTFFNTYDFFSETDKEKLKAYAENSEHTWDTFTKELAIIGDHLTHLKSSFGVDSPFYTTYFSTYVDTGSLNEAVSTFKQELLKEEKYSQDQAETIKRILK